MLDEFLQRSSIHGLSYISGYNSTTTRLFWFCVVSFFVTTCSLLAYSSLECLYTTPLFVANIEDMDFVVSGVSLICRRMLTKSSSNILGRITPAKSRRVPSISCLGVDSAQDF